MIQQCGKTLRSPPHLASHDSLRLLVKLTVIDGHLDGISSWDELLCVCLFSYYNYSLVT
jgi:hypothetical protein